MKTKERISYGFTKNPYDLNQYYTIREDVYTSHFKLQDYSTHEDIYDEQEFTKILVIKDGEKIVGGARIIFHYKNSGTLLPFETMDFQLANELPQYNLKNKSYCEVDRTALLPEYRQGGIGEKIVELATIESKLSGADYLFTIGPAIQVRNNRRHCYNLGINFKVLDNVPPEHPSYEGKRMYLTVTDLNKVKLERYEQISMPDKEKETASLKN